MEADKARYMAEMAASHDRCVFLPGGKPECFEHASRGDRGEQGALRGRAGSLYENRGEGLSGVVSRPAWPAQSSPRTHLGNRAATMPQKMMKGCEDAIVRHHVRLCLQWFPPLGAVAGRRSRWRQRMQSSLWRPTSQRGGAAQRSSRHHCRCRRCLFLQRRCLSLACVSKKPRWQLCGI